jgi:hypothetical protein
MNYLNFVVLIFITSYLISKNYNASLFVSLIALLSVTTFNYNCLQLNLIIILLLLFKLNDNNTKLINFILISYVFYSITELLVHKHVMHCNKDSIISKTLEQLQIPIVTNHYFDTCEHHIDHHISVKSDMTLSHVNHKQSLFMGWNVFIHIFILTSITLILSKYVSNYDISYKYIFIISLVLTYIWSYLWNKIHIKMHDYDTEYSIREGPYDSTLETGFIKDLLLNNHTKHHLQKGVKKGNFNVIILGADEWFGYNNKAVDNSE